MDWIDLAQDRVKWRAVLNVVMKLIHKTQGIFCVASGTVGFPRRTLFSEVRYKRRGNEDENKCIMGSFHNVFLGSFHR